MEKEEFRAIIQHFHQKKWTAAQIKAELNAVHGDSAPTLKTIYSWINKFKSGETCIEDKACSGLKATMSDIVVKIYDMVVKDRRVKVREIAKAVGISTERVHNILHEELDMKKLYTRWVPQLLTFDEKRTRKNVSTHCLAMFQRDPQDFLHRFVTVNEIWIHCTTESKEQSEQWTVPGESASKKAALLPSKVLVTVFWDYEGIILIDYLQKSKTTGKYYATLLDHLRDELRKKRPRLAGKKVLFHQDDTPPHESVVAMAKLYQLGYELIPHPPHSPDLALCDFFLFSNMKIWLSEKKFSVNEEITVVVNEYFAGFDTAYFSNGIKQLEIRWTKCIALDGDYVENILQNEKNMSSEMIKEKMNLDESDCCPRRSKRRQNKRRQESNSEDEDETYIPKINGIPIIIKRKSYKKTKLKYSTPNGTKQVRTIYITPTRSPSSSLPSEKSNESKSLFPQNEPAKIECQEAVVKPLESTVIPPQNKMNLIDSSMPTRYEPSAIPSSLYHTAIMNQNTTSTTYIRPTMVNPTFHQIILPPPPPAVQQQIQTIRSSSYKSSQSLRNSTNAMVSISKPMESRARLIFPAVRASEETLTPNIIDLDSDSDDEPEIIKQHNTNNDTRNADLVDICSDKIIPVALFSTENDNNIREDQPLIEVCTTLKRPPSSFSDIMLTHSRELDTFLGNLKENMHDFFILPDNEMVKDSKLAIDKKIKLFHKNMRETVFQLAHINDRVLREYNKWERSRKTETETSSTNQSTIMPRENIDIPLNMTCVNESDTESDCDKSEYEIMESSDYIKSSNILEDLLLSRKSVKHCGVGNSALSTENKAIQVYDVLSRDYEKCIGYSLLNKVHHEKKIDEDVLELAKMKKPNKNFDKYQEQFIFYLQHIEDYGIETEDMKGLGDADKTVEKSIISDSSNTLEFRQNIDLPIASTEKSENCNQEERSKSCVNFVVSDKADVPVNATDCVEITQINNDLDSNNEMQSTRIQLTEKIGEIELSDVQNNATLNDDDVNSSKNADDTVYIEAAVTGSEDCTIIED